MGASDGTKDFSGLAGALEGSLALPGHDGWDIARQAWNLAVDQRPDAVVTAGGSSDAKAVVDFARQNGLRVAPQGTGHGAGALGDLGGAILFKTHELTKVDVDVAAGRARAEPGALSRDVLNAAGPQGLAALAGSSPDVGIVGYSLGGGIGFLARKHGLQANRVTAIEVVTGSGDAVRADHESEADLFWALRGGGGSYGLVTAIEFELLPIAGLYAGALAWPWERSGEVLARWAEWTADAPEEISSSARMIQFPPLPQVPEPLRGRQLVMIDGVWDGDRDRADSVLAPLRELAPEMDTWAEIPTAALVEVHGDPPEPVPSLTDHRLIREIPPELIETWVEVAGPGSGSPLLFSELRHWGGAIAREPEGAGVLGSISEPYSLFNVGMAPDPAVEQAGRAQAARICDALAPWSGDRRFANFTEQVVDPSVPHGAENLERLGSIRRAVDPNSIFQAAHPVTPG
jgi:FAD/FMN-containing dehydrogenase